MLVSVVIPCYNHGVFLEDAVRSILQQTLKNFEIIIVNDASTDDPAYYTKAETLGAQVITLANNSGTAIANNTGIRESRGEYITMMSADDMREPLSLQKLLDACVANPHRFAYDDMTLLVNGEKKNKFWKFPEYDFLALLDYNTIHAGIMFERQAFIDTGGYPEEFADGREDWAFNILLGEKGYCGVHVAYPGYIYRRYEGNRTLSNNTPEWKQIFRDKIKRRFAYLYEGRFPMGCCGGRSSVKNVRQPEAPVSLPLVGAEGMTALEYLGGNYGTTGFYGKATGTRYLFDAAGNRMKMVDNRDLPYLLDLRQHTRALFQVVQDIPETAPEPAPQLTPLSTIMKEETKVYKQLAEAGLATLEDIVALSADTIVAKVDISTDIAEQLLKKAKDGLA